MSRLKEYLSDKTIQEHESQYKMPYSLFTILKSALWEYYLTVDMKIGCQGGDFAIINNQYVTLTIASDSDYMANYYSCIINFQSFLEQYIVSILEKIHPVIVKGGMNELDVLNAATWNFDEEKLKSSNTLNFNVILKRLQFMISNEEQLPEKLRIGKEYHFLSKHIEVIKLLTELRNEALHKGGKILNFYALDFLVINHVLPIITDILKLDKRMVPLDRNLYCGKNVLKELCTIKVEEEYNDVNKYKELITRTDYIWHLKALGRASFFNSLYMEEWGEGPLRNAFLEKREHERKLPESMASTSKDLVDIPCPCCGTKSFLYTEYTYDGGAGGVVPFKAKCIQCLYELMSFMGDPKDFGIADKSIFVTAHYY
ncbi:MAG TPA: hypothetical protein VNY36_03520 [Bacteroidia bacterium]|jgi:hypothetical protein|nr:hypothetical protein [Bacteroidia bacterium]